MNNKSNQPDLPSGCKDLKPHIKIFSINHSASPLPEPGKPIKLYIECVLELELEFPDDEDEA